MSLREREFRLTLPAGTAVQCSLGGKLTYGCMPAIGMGMYLQVRAEGICMAVVPLCHVIGYGRCYALSDRGSSVLPVFNCLFFFSADAYGVFALPVVAYECQPRRVLIFQGRWTCYRCIAIVLIPAALASVEQA